MNTSTAPARTRTRRALAPIALIGVVAAGITVVTVEAAQAANPPAFPHNIVVFPKRDFVSIEGYDTFNGRRAIVTVTRGGVETSRAEGTITAGGLEINHPGGECWQGVTPDIKPRDLVTVRFPFNGASDSTRTQVPAVTGFSTGGVARPFDLTVTGVNPAGYDLGMMEQRIVAPDLKDTAVGRRDIRATLVGQRPGPYSSAIVSTGATTWKATYTFRTSATTTAQDARDMLAIAAAGQMRALSWQLTDGAGNRQGITIDEFGELGGPGFGGCPAGPGALPPNAPTGVTATAGNQSVTASWTKATTVPDGSPVSGYKVTAINTANLVETSVNAPLCTTACSATIPGLTNGATYRIEVRALSAAGGLSAPGKAVGSLSPAGVGLVRPATPTGVTATAGDAADLVVDASVSWTAPAQPVGVTVEAWRITAYDSTSLAPIKRVFLDEPIAPADTTRTRTIGFASTGNVLFRVQAVGADDAGTMSILSDASSAVAAQ